MINDIDKLDERSLKIIYKLNELIDKSKLKRNYFEQPLLIKSNSARELPYKEDFEYLYFELNLSMEEIALILARIQKNSANSYIGKLKKKLGITKLKTKEQNYQISKKIILEKYGVENVFQNKDIKQKIRKTNYKKYGVYSPLQNKDIYEKAKQTNLSKTGYVCAIANPEKRNKALEAFRERTGLKAYHQQPESLKKLRNSKFIAWSKKHKLEDFDISDENDNMILVSSLKEIWESKQVKYQCKKCGEYTSRFYMDVHRIISCSNCEQEHFRNRLELVLSNYLNKNNIKNFHGVCLFSKTLNNNFNPIPAVASHSLYNRPMEGDIIIPNNSDSPENGGIIIEINDFATHTIEYHPKDYHRIKTEQALKQGYKLYHFWEDMSYKHAWSFLQQKLHIRDDTLIRVFARNTECRYLTSKNELQEVDELLQNNHILKGHHQTYNFGLFDKKTGEMLSCLTLSKLKQKNVSNSLKETILNNERYCVKNNVQIVGGGQKLWKFVINWIKNNLKDITEIVTYIDRDLTPDVSDSLYYRIGFRQDLNQQYSYTMYYYVSKDIYDKNNKLVFQKGKYFRHTFMKYKLKTLFSNIDGFEYKEEDTEYTMLHKLGIYQIYNSGVIKMVLPINQ